MMLAIKHVNTYLALSIDSNIVARTKRTGVPAGDGYEADKRMRSKHLRLIYAGLQDHMSLHLR